MLEVFTISFLVGLPFGYIASRKIEEHIMIEKYDEDFNEGHAEFARKHIITNHLTDEQLYVNSIHFDRDICDIVYKCQKGRYRFDMVTIPESVILRNIERGQMTVKEREK